MQKLFRRISVMAVIMVSMIAPTMAIATVSAADADVDSNLNCGANLDASNIGGGATCNTGSDQGGKKITTLVTAIINILSFVVGVAAVIMIIIGGIRYTTSGGDSGSVSGAKNTIIYAIVGLVVVALAQAIVRLVVNKATS